MKKNTRFRQGYMALLLVLVSVLLRAQQEPLHTTAECRTLLANSRPDSNRVALLLELGQHYLQKQGEVPADIDSATVFIQKASQLSNSLKYEKGQALSLFYLSKVFRKKNQTASGTAYLKQALAAFENKGYWFEAGEVLHDMATLYPLSESMPERLALEYKALEYFRKVNNYRYMADTYKEIADLHQVEHKFHEAIQELKKALELYQTIHYTSLQGVYDLLGNCYTTMGDYEEGFKYGLLAVKTAEAVGDTSIQFCTINNRLGVTCFHMKEYKLALFYFKTAYAIADRYGDLSAVDIVARHVSITYMKLNMPLLSERFLQEEFKKYPPQNNIMIINYATQFIILYSKLKQADKALPFVKQLQALLRTENMTRFHMLESDRALFQYYMCIGNWKEARHYANAHAQAKLADGIEINRDLDAASMFFKVDSAEGKYLSALKHNERYWQIRQSMMDDSKQQQITQMQVLYDTEKKDKDLQLKSQSIALLQQQGQLQKGEIEQSRLLRNVTLAGALVLVVLIALLYNRYQFKQRNNLKLMTQQEEISRQNEILQNLIAEKDTLLEEKEWLLKEIHHRVKNNLQIVMSLLNTQAVYLNDDAAIMAIRDSQHRVHSMSLIHQKLYQSENVSSIKMISYIQELLQYLRDSFGTSQRIQFQLDIDPVEMDVAHAVPLGLILNEAITNAIKYAFPDTAPGLIHIGLKDLGEGRMELIIRDSGKGLPDNFHAAQSGSLGLTMMEGLAGDLDGSFAIRSEGGVEIRIVFKQDPERDGIV